MPYQLIQDIVLRVNNLVSNNFILSQSITPSPQSSFGSLLALKQSSFIFSVHSFLSFHCPTPCFRSTPTASTSPLIHSLKLQSLQASQSSSHLLIKPTGGLISQTSLTIFHVKTFPPLILLYQTWLSSYFCDTYHILLTRPSFCRHPQSKVFWHFWCAPSQLSIHYQVFRELENTNSMT